MTVSLLLFCVPVLLAAQLAAQTPANLPATPAKAASAPTAPGVPGPSVGGPIAIVPLDPKDPGSAAMVAGALQVAGGKAIIAASGTVTAGATTAEVTLPHRGVLRICASTSVKLAADSSVPAGEVPGLMMVMNHGAVEASFATGRNSDILLTPDFRILIGGPGAAEVKVRLGQHGDTCVDNAGANAPYVLVSSVFDGGAYRVKPGQRVMFQHGSLYAVVDQEKEPCGCPPPPQPNSNEFPLAQSAGLAPLAKPAPPGTVPSGASPDATQTFVYKSGERGAEADAGAAPTSSLGKPPKKHKSNDKKPGFLSRLGHFFRRLFGAE